MSSPLGRVQKLGGRLPIWRYLRVASNLRSDDVLAVVSGVFFRYGVSEHVRSDNGSEFTTHRVRDLLAQLEVQTLFIEPGSPW